MRIYGTQNIARAVDLYEGKWSAAYPGEVPPRLPPDGVTWGDPRLLEAARIWAEAEAEAEREDTAGATIRSTGWTAIAGGIGCPNGHYVPISAAFCPQCGLEVPPFIAAEARTKTEDLNNRASLNQLRIAYP